MIPVFVDASAFVALSDRRDRNHRVAARILRVLEKRHRPLTTSTFIVDEVITTIRRKIGHAEAVTVGSALWRSEWCRVVEITEAIRVAAWQIFVRYDDQTFSFTDCTSFAVMHMMEQTEAFTFDRRDFLAAGFVVIP